MAVSETQICNMALTELGAGKISNYLEDASEKAVNCRLYYEPAVDEVLRSHEWNSAIWYQSLAKVVSTDDNYMLTDYDEWQYQFQLPTDPFCLRPLEIPDYKKYDYEIVGNYLITNLSTVLLKYIRRLTDPTAFGPLLVKAIMYKLAADMAVKITGSEGERANMLVMYNLQLNRAKDINGREAEEPQVETWALRDAKDL